MTQHKNNAHPFFSEMVQIVMKRLPGMHTLHQYAMHSWPVNHISSIYNHYMYTAGFDSLIDGVLLKTIIAVSFSFCLNGILSTQTIKDPSPGA